MLSGLIFLVDSFTVTLSVMLIELLAPVSSLLHLTLTILWEICLLTQCLVKNKSPLICHFLGYLVAFLLFSANHYWMSCYKIWLIIGVLVFFQIYFHLIVGCVFFHILLGHMD